MTIARLLPFVFVALLSPGSIFAQTPKTTPQLTLEQVTNAYAAVMQHGCTVLGYVTSSDSQSEGIQPNSGFIASSLAGRSYVLGFPTKTTNDDLVNLAPHLKRLPGLAAIDLSHSANVSDSGVAHLKDLKEIEALFLNGTKTGDGGAKHLQTLEKLRYLDLSNTRISDKGLQELCKLSSLQVLLIADNSKLSDQCLESLARLAKLRELDCSGTAICFAANNDPKAWSSLRRLNFSRTDANDDTFKNLAGFKDLEYLDGSYTKITGKSAAQLVQLKSLRELRLNNAPVDDEGAKAIGKLTQLRVLELTNAHPPGGKDTIQRVRITDAGLGELAAPDKCPFIDWE